MLDAFSIAASLMLTFLGLYFLIKGFGFEEEVFSRLSNFFDSLSLEKISTFAYIISFIVFSWSVMNGYLQFEQSKPPELAEAVAVFLVAAADMILIAWVISIIGRIIDEFNTKKYLSIRRDLILLAFGFMVYTILKPAADLYLPLSPFEPEKFVLSALIGVLTFLAIIYFTKYLFIEEIRQRRKTIDFYSKKDVVDESGNRIGHVSKVLLNGSGLEGIKVGRKMISADDILSADDTVTVKSTQ